jgi:pantoate--beta-alanine ligase
VVTKLFNIVQPHEAVFGLKDYQQWLAIRRMAGDLNMAVKVTGRPIVREKDGLAMSSRNTYLSPAERKAALGLYRSLSMAKYLVRKGEKSPERIKKTIKELITSYNSAKIEIEYVSFCHPETLDERDIIKDKTLLAIGARVGKTRLIDNCLLSPGE